MNKCKERFVRSVVRVLAAIITTIPCIMPKQQCNGMAGRSWTLHSPPMIPVTLHRLQWWRRNKYKNTRINILFLLNQLLGAHTDRRINKMYMLNKYSGCCRTHQSDELFISSVRVFCSIHDRVLFVSRMCAHNFCTRTNGSASVSTASRLAYLPVTAAFFLFIRENNNTQE